MNMVPPISIHKKFSRGCELVISYQFRDKNRVSKLKRSFVEERGGVCQRVKSALTACGSCSSLVELTINQARLRITDIEELVRFLRRHSRFMSLTFKTCLLERMDAILPLFRLLAKSQESQLQTISFIAVEVLEEDQDMSRHNSVPLTTHSCMVRPFLKLDIDVPAMSKLTLQNVDLSGASDGRLLANFFERNNHTKSLEMYQSMLGPQGSEELSKAMVGSASAGLKELNLRYCSLDDFNGVPLLVRQVGSSTSSITKLGLYRNRSAPAIILQLLGTVLRETRSLQELILSDSPFLFGLASASTATNRANHDNTNDENNAEHETSVLDLFLQQLGLNETLRSLNIVCCGLTSSMIAPIIRALENKSQFTSLRLRGSRLEEEGLDQLVTSLPKLSCLQSLEIFCSADRLQSSTVEAFSTAAQQHDTLVEFEGSGWLDSKHDALLQHICLRNDLLSKSRSLLLLPDDSTPVSLWPHALSKLFHAEPTKIHDRSCKGDDDERDCGHTAAFAVLQGIQSLLVKQK